MTLAQALTIDQSLHAGTLQRLLDRSRTVDSGCREWLGYLMPTGYGEISVACVSIRIHRVMYAIAHGPIPEGAVVMHSCDNRKCIEPAHLSLGTIYSNGQDAKAKGRCKYQKITHCANGHPLSGDNVRATKQGGRACKTCQRAAQRRASGWPEERWFDPPGNKVYRPDFSPNREADTK